MDLVKMEKNLDLAITIMCVLTILYIINGFVELIHIPAVIVGILLALLAILFFLRAIVWKKNQSER